MGLVASLNPLYWSLLLFLSPSSSPSLPFLLVYASPSISLIYTQHTTITIHQPVTLAYLGVQMDL